MVRDTDARGGDKEPTLTTGNLSGEDFPNTTLFLKVSKENR